MMNTNDKQSFSSVKAAYASPGFFKLMEDQIEEMMPDFSNISDVDPENQFFNLENSDIDPENLDNICGPNLIMSEDVSSQDSNGELMNILIDKEINSNFSFTFDDNQDMDNDIFGAEFPDFLLDGKTLATNAKASKPNRCKVAKQRKSSACKPSYKPTRRSSSPKVSGSKVDPRYDLSQLEPLLGAADYNLDPDRWVKKLDNVELTEQQLKLAKAIRRRVLSRIYASKSRRKTQLKQISNFSEKEKLERANRDLQKQVDDSRKENDLLKKELEHVKLQFAQFSHNLLNPISSRVFVAR